MDGTVSEGDDATPVPLRKGSVVRGSVGYKRRENNSRELEIEIAWEVGGEEREKGRQSWLLR